MINPITTGASASEDTATFDPVLSWSRQDLEQRFAFHGGRFTDTNRTLTFLLAAVLTVFLFVFAFYVMLPNPWMAPLAEKLLDRGVVPYPIVFLSFWGFVILFIKSRKLSFQTKALELSAVPQEPEFSLNPGTARTVLERIEGLVDDHRNFILFNRIHVALSNLQNIGQISDVSSLIRSQSEIDEDQVSSSYNLVTGFIWAVPVLGFIGTVLGLGDAIGGFGQTLEAGAEMDALRESLQAVTAGLSTAFDTTLLGLVGALFLQLFTTFSRQKEMSFLDRCNDYCQTYVVAKLKLTEKSKS